MVLGGFRSFHVLVTTFFKKISLDGSLIQKLFNSVHVKQNEYWVIK